MISIITPLYNKADYIGETVESVRGQTFQDWEMWVVDNCSTDDGPALVRGLAANDRRVRLLACTHAQGPGAARNFGLDAAAREWVLFLDADDLIEPTYLADRLATAAAQPRADVVAGPWQEFRDGQPGVLQRRNPPGWGEDASRLTDQIVGYAPWPPLAAIVRRSWLGGERLWQEELDRFQSEDTAFWFRVLSGARVAWSEADGARYRTSTPSSRDAIRDVRKRFDAICAVTDHNAAFVHSQGEQLGPTQRQTLVRVFESEARRAQDAGDTDVARLARQRAREWLLAGPLMRSPGMLFRRAIGIGNFLRLQALMPSAVSRLTNVALPLPGSTGDADVPLVFFHQGNRPHLARTLAMARHTDPPRPVVLLGDDANRALAQSLGVRHVSADDYGAGARRLGGLYVHRSTLGREFELACLQRWFSILEWMESAGVDRIVYLDSDVLLFAPLAPVLAALSSWPMTMVIDAAHTAVINRRSALREFCRLVENHYDSEEGLDKLDDLHRAHLSRSNLGGISDMTFLQLFLRTRPDLIASTPGPLGEAGWMLDLTINDGVGGFEMSGPFKRIEWHRGIPHGRRIADGTWLPFLTLHFQGLAKRLVPRFAHRLPLGIRLRIWNNDGRVFFARIRRWGLRLRSSLQR